jgi:hypothetical protein
MNIRGGHKRYAFPRPGGFSMIELMVVLGITLFVLAAASKVMVAMITQFKQQSKIVETNIEGLVGLELLRRDVQGMGHGLGGGLGTIGSDTYDGFDWSVLVNYNEVHALETAAALYNDATDFPPRPIVSGNNLATRINTSDYLVIKSVNLGLTAAAGKVHTLRCILISVASGSPVCTSTVVNQWNPIPANADLDPNLQEDDRVVVLSIGDNANLGLVRDTSLNWWTTRGDAAGTTMEPVAPTSKEDEPHLLYGVDSDNDLRAPFNRADYYIENSPEFVPDRCAPGTGILVKSVMQHSDGRMGAALPLMDCVADFQLTYGIDNDNDADNEIDDIADDTPAASQTAAAEIRDALRVVFIDILMHEGQFDKAFTYDPTPLDKSDAVTTISVGTHKTLDLATLEGGNALWANYRWRVLHLAIVPTLLQ